MSKLEVFFDYACPYCLKGHEYLEEVIKLYPSVEIVWCPCEAHPRPETYGPHSDLCIQGMFYAKEKGVDLWDYHILMYKAALEDKIDIESVDALAEAVRGLLDPDEFRTVIQSGRFAQDVLNANDYAYEQSGVWAVPAYRMNGKKLDSAEGIGVTKEQLKGFLIL